MNTEFQLMNNALGAIYGALAKPPMTAEQYNTSIFERSLRRPSLVSPCCHEIMGAEDICPVCDEPCEPIDFDPTPYCAYCRAMKEDACKCGPLADNE